MDKKMYSQEHIVIFDKRNNLVLGYNGNSVNPIEDSTSFSDSSYMKFDKLDEAQITLEYECDVEELNENNYEVGTIRVEYSRI
jgi:hypothetical protein